ncbi:MAG: bifunctional folylpolyglutamate synthase/dihydrofolate synthase [Erysipelotrichaceae bacterium]|nr:bifunctional folylpolyglutamate synthase/dihydrofolate synthase [Erysipelotrichaceae bacterium]MCI9524604.1 bifunctional folylpolyglutamate synthase/dihydrofolate synthase [Erysipelotrichaceae bacterium]
MTVAEVLKEIEERRNRGKGIENFSAYLSTIHNPQNSLRCVHIAGTNGKGSTLNYLRAILQKSGYRVGTFSSPYLETHFDRIRINDIPISEDAFMSYYAHDHEGWYTYDLCSFEIDTAIAFRYFQDERCDICIIETGIGGRYDCTNVLNPLVCIITNIGKDHMDQLGYRYEEIAWQKGGIIKFGVPLITAERKEECQFVLKEICKEQQSDWMEIQAMRLQSFNCEKLVFSYRHLVITLYQAARYQMMNCVCAIEAAFCLRSRNGFQINDDVIVSSLAKTHWKGRFETISTDPLIILDGAHNEEGIRALCHTLRSLSPVKILFSALKDKESDVMLRQLCEVSDEVWVSEFDFYRVKPAKELAQNFPVHVEEDFRFAIQAMIEMNHRPLIITGSLYFISETRAFLLQEYLSKN